MKFRFQTDFGSRKRYFIKNGIKGPGRVAQLVTASPPCAKVAGLITSQATYQVQPANA